MRKVAFNLKNEKVSIKGEIRLHENGMLEVYRTKNTLVKERVVEMRIDTGDIYSIIANKDDSTISNVIDVSLIDSEIDIQINNNPLRDDSEIEKFDDIDPIDNNLIPEFQ